MPSSHQIRTLFKSNLFQVLDYRCSGQRESQEEWSATHEIILPRSGTYVRRDALGQVVADPNQILFSNRNQPYEISHPIKGEDRSTVILLSSDTLLEIARDLDASVLDRPETPFPRAGITTDSQLHLSHYWLMRVGGQDSFSDSLAVEEALIALLGKILARVFTIQPARSARRLPGTVREHIDLVHRVKLLLDARFQERLLLDEIAAAVYTSPFHLSRVFKRHTGLTIHRYRQRLRLLHAAERMLEHPQENLDRIALDLGFANHSHFAAAFGRTFNLSPSDFRRSATSRQFRRMSKILKA